MKHFLLFLILGLFIFCGADAQKVAVVLSGGGAKGLAHIGVLKVLEENSIPIDYVVGTSMGAIVGGFYAAGYSPDEIEYIVQTEAFQDWVAGKPERGYNYYYHTKGKTASVFDFELVLDTTLNTYIKPNIASDVSLNFALAEHLAQASQAANYNFNNLMVPFRAIAAEILTQQSVIMKSGPLNEAVRASMSVPFIYRPIKVNNRYLFDGGIYNNFPVNVARKEFNPDVIIAVNVSSKVFDTYPYNKDEELLSKSLLLMMLDKSDLTQLNDKDIYIEPNLQNYTGFDFPSAQAIIDSGYVCAERKIAELKSKISRRSTCDTVAMERNQFMSKFKPLRFDNVELTGFTLPQRRFVNRFFKFQNEKYLYLNDIKTGYYRLTSEDYFKYVVPNIVYDDSVGSYEFQLKDNARKYLKIDVGGNISSRNISEIYLGLGYKTFTGTLMDHHLGIYTGRFYQSINANSRIYFPGERSFYFQPSFVINKWDYIGTQDFLFTEIKPDVLKLIDRKLSVKVGLPFGNKYKLELESGFVDDSNEFSNLQVLSTNDTLDQMDFHGWKNGMVISASSLDKKQFPMNGRALDFRLFYIFGNEQHVPGSTSILDGSSTNNRRWFFSKLSYQEYHPFGRHFNLGWQFEALMSNQPFFSNYMSSLIMAPTFYPLLDSRTIFLENFKAHQYLSGGIKNIFPLSRNFQIRLEGYAFLPIRKIMEKDQIPYDGPLFSELSFAGTAALIFNSPIGPISANLNYYDDRQNEFGFVLSLGYLIFNNRSTE